MATSSATSSSTTASTPRVSTRRASRFASPRPFSSPLAAVRKIGRPPVVLEWGSAVIRVGYAEQFQPQHILPLPEEPFKRLEEYKTTRKLNTTSAGTSQQQQHSEEESQWYDVVSPIIRHVFDRLMVDPTTRRVVVVAVPFPVRAWEAAVKAALWNLGVPAVSFCNFLEVVPMAQGWKRGLAVHVGREESHLMAHVDGHPLSFTYQGL